MRYDVEAFYDELKTKTRRNEEDWYIFDMLDDMDPEVKDIWPATTSRRAPWHMLR